MAENSITRAAIDTAIGYSRHLRHVLLAKKLDDTSGAEEKHLLLLAWLFPPMVSGGVYRPLSFVREAVRRGWKVTVISGPAPTKLDEAGKSLLHKLPGEVTVIRMSENHLKPSYRLFPQIDGGFANIADTLECVQRHKIEHVSHVLATGPRFHNFVAACYIADQFSASCILDYRDEWSQCPFPFVRKGNTDMYFERRCLERADHVLVTTRSFLEQSKKTFTDIPHGKFSVVPNGFETEDFLQERNHVWDPPSDDRVRIAFIGTLSRHSLPTSFLSTLQQTVEDYPEAGERVRLLFVGARQKEIETELANHPLAGQIELRDQVSKGDAILLMQSMDALLAINPPDLARYIPGKLFEYIAAKTPILVYGEGGEVAPIVDKLNVGKVVPDGDAIALRDTILSLGRNQADQNSRRDEWLAAHERTHIAQELFELIG